MEFWHFLHQFFTVEMPCFPMWKFKIHKKKLNNKGLATLYDKWCHTNVVHVEAAEPVGFDVQ